MYNSETKEGESVETEEKKSLIGKYYDMVYKLAVSQTKDLQHAEDVTNDTFLKFIETDKQFDSEEHVKAWLIRVTINRSKSVFLSAWYRKTVPLEENISVEMSEGESEVYTAVLKLPPKYRAVIHLFYYEDLSVAEIADSLKIQPSTVRSQLTRGRAMLKDVLKGAEVLV